MFYQTDEEALTERIRQSMREHKVTVSSVAQKCGMTRQTAHKYLARPKNAPLGALMKIAYYSGIRQITLKTGGLI